MQACNPFWAWDINWNKHVRAFTVAEMLLHHMVAENYYWLVQFGFYAFFYSNTI